MIKPEINSRWVRGDNTLDPDMGDYNGYTVVAITNTAHEHERHPPQVIYRGDNGHWWSLPLADWPGNLMPEPGRDRAADKDEHPIDRDKWGR